MPALIDLPQHAHLQFVTGKLAESAVREVVEALSKRYAFHYSVSVMPITVAALITPRWLAKKLIPESLATHLILPGFCESGKEELQHQFEQQVVIGPKDCRDMGILFGEGGDRPALDAHDIEIIAEINHAPQLSTAAIIRRAEQMARDGADVIDIGCDPGKRFSSIAEVVAALTQRGLRVSVDSFDPWEAEQGTRAGAKLVLSVNSTNREAAPDWGAEVVVIPDQPSDLDGMDETIEFLSARNVAMRLDPILEPIGTGFADSLVRYHRTRERYPEIRMMMGIGNLTELSDVDSAGVNLMLLGICQELQIKSVLTTEVINWARSSIRECDWARRLVFESCRRGVPPKNFSDALVMLRDHRVSGFSVETLQQLADSIKDNNYRLYAQEDEIHLVSRGLHLNSPDPFQLFDDLLQETISDNVDPGHAFYLGYEMAKASIALQLGKQYEQDRPLSWGFLTQAEDLHRLKRANRHRDKNAPE